MPADKLLFYSVNLYLARPLMLQNGFTNISAIRMKYKIANVPGNTGEVQMVASEDIQCGELLIKEAPLVTVPNLPDEQYKFGGHAWDLVAAVADDHEIRKIFLGWNLKGSRTPFMPGDFPIQHLLSQKYRIEPDSVRSLFRTIATNNIGYHDENFQIGGFGLYRDLSRSNHSCLPNTMTYAAPQNDFAKKLAGLVAIRDIERGEAITWSYVGMHSSFLDANYESRSNLLFDTFFFACHCDRCLVEMPQADLDHKIRNDKFWDAWCDRIEQMDPGRIQINR